MNSEDSPNVTSTTNREWHAPELKELDAANITELPGGISPDGFILPDS